MRFSLILSASLMALAPYVASSLTLRLPVKCEIGRTCFIMKLVDHDSGKGTMDYRCGHLTDDGHKGTDFRLLTMQDMEPGTEVVAAAKGKVMGARDKLLDMSAKTYDVKRIAGFECGNGVRIAHEDGYTTQYCHLKKGSITVKAGDDVKAGQTLGMIGLSGATELPHLHFQVAQGEKIIDPFTGRAMNTACGQTGVSMWNGKAQEALQYRQTQVLMTGISADVPTIDGIREGKFRDASVPADSKILYYWVYGHGLQPESTITMHFKGPHDKTLVKAPIKPEKYQLEFVRYVGVKLKEEAWPTGDYSGLFTVTEMVDGVEKKQAESDWKAKVE